MTERILTRWVSGMDLPTVGATGRVVITGDAQQPFTESTRIYAGITLKADTDNVGSVEVFMNTEDSVGWPLATDGSPTLLEIKDISNLWIKGTNADDIVYYMYS